MMKEHQILCWNLFFLENFRSAQVPIFRLESDTVSQLFEVNIKWRCRITFLLNLMLFHPIWTCANRWSTADKLEVKNSLFEVFGKFEIAAKWAENIQFRHSKKLNVAFFTVYDMAHISFYSYSPFKKSVSFMI